MCSSDLPDETVATIIVAAGERLAPGIVTIVRASTEEGARHLAELGAESLVRPEFEGGLQILRSTLLTLGYPARRIQTLTDEIRERQVTGRRADDEMRLARQLAASDLELDWIEVAPGSALAGSTLADANLRGLTGATVKIGRAHV